MTRIAKRVLAFRERHRPGSIMRPSTFEEIEREAARGGARDPAAVAGAAYWKTLASRYRGNPISEEPDPSYPGEYRFVEWRRAMLGFLSSHWYGGTLTNAEYAEVARLVGMPVEVSGYDWSFIRDAEDEQVIKAFLFVQARHPELGPHRGFTSEHNPKVLLRDVKDAERDYASGAATWGEHDQGVIRRWIRWKELQKAYEAQTGKPLYAWKGNPADRDHAIRELEAARKRYEQAKTKAAKRAAAEDVEFWGNKAAFLESAKHRNPQNYATETLERGSDRVVIWANTEAGPWHVQPYVNVSGPYDATAIRERGRGYSTLARARKVAQKWLDEQKQRKGNPAVHDGDKYRAVVDRLGTTITRKSDGASVFLQGDAAAEIEEQLETLLLKHIRGGYPSGPFKTYEQHLDAVLDAYDDVMQRGNPRHKTVPELLRDCDNLKKAIRSRTRVYDANPSPVGVHRGVQMFFEGISYNAPSLKLWGYSTDLALQRAIDRKLKKAGNLQEAVKRAQFGQNPARGARVETYQLRAMTGRPIRKATKVIFEDGREVRFMERMPKRKAIRQAIEEITRHPESFPARNPNGQDAAELYRTFHGKEPQEVIELAVTAEQAGTYTVLGELVELTIESPSGNRVKLNFKDDGVKLASSGEGSQLYLFEGNQDLTECLGDFAIDTSKETLDLGDAVKIVYEAAKWQTDFKPQEWDHKFGEESGVCPRVFYRVHPPTQSQQQIFFAGGNYRVERPGIID